MNPEVQTENLNAPPAFSSITIRELHVSELAACIKGGHEFIAEAKLPGGYPFSEDHFLNAWTEILLEKRGFVLGLFENGVVTGTLAAVMANDMYTGVPIAIECWWYVLKGHRIWGMDLLDAFERVAKERGAKLVAMIHLMNLQPEKLCSVYQHLGYEEVERHFVKEVA